MPRRITGPKDSEENAAALLLERQNEQARKALELRRAGKSLFEIAEELQLTEYAVTGLVHRAIAEASALVNSATKTELLALEVQRLDQLQTAVWDAALSGDLKAVETTIKLIQARTKLLGLEDDPNAGTRVRAVVIPPGMGEYAMSLEMISRGEIGE